MGSASASIPIAYLELMSNNWKILGNFMYPAGAYSACSRGLLDPRAIEAPRFDLAALPAAIEAAAKAKSLACAVVTT